MSVNVTVNQLQEQLPEILNRTLADDSVCLIERDGENIAVIVSLRQWRRRTISEQLDARSAKYRLVKGKQQRAEELLAKERLTRAERRELNLLLAEADEILLRRAEALDNL